MTQIADPPPLLYVVGDAHLLELPQLAIVGSRNPTEAGRRTAHEFARHLAGGGLSLTAMESEAKAVSPR
ncbi:MAG: DNA-processing protein DprA [Candidatus Sedimenticola endophacoides]